MINDMPKAEKYTAKLIETVLEYRPYDSSAIHVRR